MIVIDNLAQVAAQIENERGVSADVLISAIEQALVSACRRRFPEEIELECLINVPTGEAKVIAKKEVVKTVADDLTQVSVDDARLMGVSDEVGAVVDVDVTPADFGRLAAQTAKQVMLQRIREAEKNNTYDEYKDKEGTVITGVVQHVEGRNYLINLGRLEAVITPRDQIPTETLSVKDRVRLYVSRVEMTPRGPQIDVSRSHSGLLSELFRLEIPEIQEGIIEIKSVAREAGRRAKIAVHSTNSSIGAVGTCVGHMGGRIQSIIKELGTEKIDILEWHEQPKQFIANSLKPAKISDVIITSVEEKTAVVVVPQDQLSLAIGKQGVNVRLAVRLTGWKLDIMSDAQYAEQADEIVADENEPTIVEKLKQEAPQESLVDNVRAKIAEEGPESAEEELVKISELAKIYEMKTQELIDLVAKKGIEIKSNRVKLTAEQVDEIKAAL